MRKNYIRAIVLNYLSTITNTNKSEIVLDIQSIRSNSFLAETDVSDGEVIEIVEELMEGGAVRKIDIPKLLPRYVASKALFQKRFHEISSDKSEEMQNIRLLGAGFLREFFQAYPASDINSPDIALAAAPIPAADRYVTISHNAPLSDDLFLSLQKIKDEFAQDHNKLEYKPIEISAKQVTSEIEAVQAQLRFGYIRIGLLKYLGTYLKHLLKLAKAWTGLAAMIKAAQEALQAVLDFFDNFPS